MADITHQSPFAPTHYPKIPNMAGVALHCFDGGFYHHQRNDILLMVFDAGTSAAGVMTQNQIIGEPIKWNRQYLPCDDMRGILINAGNANVCADGWGVAEDCAKACAGLLHCRHDHILLASTGVIGQKLNTEKIIQHLQPPYDSLKKTDWYSAASAIMTTDTFPKMAHRHIELSQGVINITGIAKGSGMIEPNMATMLSFISTDALLSPQECDVMLRQAVKNSFNSISVDSDTSTSDMVIFTATKQAFAPNNDHDWHLLQQSLNDLCLELALMVIGDGEGIKHRFKVTVSGCQSHDDAKKIARAIANSPLVKTAIAGEDANWGRIAMATGKAGVAFDQDRLSIAIANINIIDNGRLRDDYNEDILQPLLSQKDINIDVSVGNDIGNACVWGCDLTHEYININADYRS